MRSGAHALSLPVLSCIALLLTSCKSLPQLETERSAKPSVAASRSAHIRSSRGTLSPQRSAALIEKLKRERGKVDFFDLHLAVEEAVAGSPLTSGNQAVLLHDGEDTYSAMLNAIEGAKHHINMETYIFEDDEVGRRFADALIRKQQQGVQVAVIRDSVGTLSTPAEFFQRMTDSGIQVLEFNPINPLASKAPWSINNRDHRKLLIVDGQVAFLGGINISNVYSRSLFSSGTRTTGEIPWRDTDVALRGPIVNELQKLFLDTWIGQHGKSLGTDSWFPTLAPAGNAVVRAIGSSPDDAYSAIYVTLISAFRSAQHEIWIANAYFVPDRQMIKVLKDAARHGVDVRVILPSLSDSWLVLKASHAHYTELLKAGVKLYQRRNALLHAKTVVVDGVWSTVGSSNLDWRSFLHNQEVNVVILGTEFGEQMRSAFEKDLAESEALTLEQWKRRPAASRFGEWLGRLWEYWL